MKIKSKSWKEHLEKSIELDQQEDDEFRDESGNSVPEPLTDKEKFKETVKKIQESSKDNRNKDKLRSSSLNLLKKKQKKNPKKVFKKTQWARKKSKRITKRGNKYWPWCSFND